MAYSGLGTCGRLDVALALFESSARRRQDIQPAGCSALLKVANEAGDEELALRIFDRIHAAKVGVYACGVVKVLARTGIYAEHSKQANITLFSMLVRAGLWICALIHQRYASQGFVLLSSAC